MEKPWIQSLVTGLGILAAYIWVNNSILRLYSLQAFGISFLLFFILKKIRGKQDIAIEMGVITFSFLLVVTQTGAAESLFYPLIYVLLFLLIFSEHLYAAFSTTLLILIYFWMIIPSFQSHHIASLATIPMLAIFFYFTKKQHDQVLLDKALINLDRKALGESKKNIQKISSFNQSFLKDHLKTLRNLLDDPQIEKDTIQSHLELLENEIDKISSKHIKKQGAIQQELHEVSEALSEVNEHV